MTGNIGLSNLLGYFSYNTKYYFALFFLDYIYMYVVLVKALGSQHRWPCWLFWAMPARPGSGCPEHFIHFMFSSFGLRLIFTFVWAIPVSF